MVSAFDFPAIWVGKSCSCGSWFVHVKKDVFCVVTLRQKGRRWKFGKSIIYLNINSNKWSSFQENDLPIPRFHFVQFRLVVCLSSTKKWKKNWQSGCQDTISNLVTIHGRHRHYILRGKYMLNHRLGQKKN